MVLSAARVLEAISAFCRVSRGSIEEQVSRLMRSIILFFKDGQSCTLQLPLSFNILRHRLGGLGCPRLAHAAVHYCPIQEAFPRRSVLKSTGEASGVRARPQYLLEIRKLAVHLQPRPSAYPYSRSREEQRLCNLPESRPSALSDHSTLLSRRLRLQFNDHL